MVNEEGGVKSGSEGGSTVDTGHGRVATMDIEGPSQSSSHVSIASLNKGTPNSLSESIARSFLQQEPEAREPIAGGSCCRNGNIRTLLLTAALFGVITLAQLIAAEIAHSEALMADCVAMGVDVLTYFLHIFIELRKGKSMHRQLQILGPVVSISILVYFTGRVMADAYATVTEPQLELDEVNPWIVGSFAVWGIVFDLFAMWAFVRNAKAEGQQDATSRTDERSVSLESGGGGEQLVPKGGSRTETHMMAAFMHVSADFATSITTLIAAVMIAFWDLNGPKTDALACLFVGGIILLGAGATIVEVVKDFSDKGCAPDLDA